MSALFEIPTYRYIDPSEIQAWPPKEVEEAIEKAGIDYAEFLDGVTGLLIQRSPRFAQDLCPYLESYFHEHNFERPLTEDEESRLRGMIENPETIEVSLFRDLAPIVLLKACTLASETFIQNRPGWVLKAIPHFTTIQKEVLPG
ncbi:MAG: hypothetical protein ACLGIN_15350 [Candidatus Sericytochromatia bacterium]